MAAYSISGYLARLGTVLFGSSVGAALQRNILSGYAQTGLSIVFTLISYPLYLGALGREEFSIWLIVASVIGMNTIGTFGLSTALLKQTAEYRADTGGDQIERVFAHSAAAVVLLTLLFCGSIYLFSGAVLGFLNISGVQIELAMVWLRWMCLLVPLSFLADQFYSLVAGLGRYDLANASRAVQQAVVIGVAAVVFALGYRYHALPVATGISFCVQLVMLIHIARRYLPRFPRWIAPTDMGLHRSLLKLGGQAAGGSAIQLGFHLLNRVLVARYLGLAQVPVYEIAFNSSMRLRGALVSGFNSLLPESARVTMESGSIAAPLRLVVRSLTLRVAAFAVVLWLVILFGGQWVMSLWLGREVGVPVHAAFLVLSFGALMNACSIPAFYALLGIGRFRLMLETSTIVSVVNISLFFALLAMGMPWMNPAVLAAAAALVVSAAWILAVAWRAGAFSSSRAPVSAPIETETASAQLTEL